jgi:hypothetical protein
MLIRSAAPASPPLTTCRDVVKSGSPEPGFFLWNILNPQPVLGVANNQLGKAPPLRRLGWRKPRLHESRGFLFDLVGSFSPFSGMRRCWE